MADLLSLSKQLRDALDGQDAAEIERLTIQFQSLVDTLEGDIDSLAKDIAAGDISAQAVQELDSYERLLRNTEKQLTNYQKYLSAELALLAGAWLSLGRTNSTLLMEQAIIEAGSDAEIIPFEIALLDSLNKYLADGSPLAERLAEYTSVNLDRLRQVIIDSVLSGKNPKDLARLIVEEGFGMSLTDALRMARTLQLYAYRDATLLNYQENSDIIKGWVWSSALIPGRTCMSCVNMHGTIHGLDETLNDHHNGLCAMLPLVGENPIKINGAEWFARLPKKTQIEMMGQSKYDAWKAGTIDISDMTHIREDPVYGEMRGEKSLKMILEEKNVEP